jgi:uncharacterized protein YqhQ
VRTPTSWAVAVRKQDGTIHTESHEVPERFARFRRTILRGPLALVESVSIGMRAIAVALRHSSGVEITPSQMGSTLAPVIVGALAVFVVAPGIVTAGLDGWIADAIEAFGRVGVLVLYLALISRSAQTRRLFGYHGAEHMAIAAFERAGRAPTTEEVSSESPIHVRCGTNFIALFVISAAVIYAFVPRRPLWLGGSLRLVLAPVVAAVAYEVMRAAAKWPEEIWARAITWAGRALQHITTRRPEADQVEVAMASLVTALGDGQGNPSFSDPPEGRN